MPMLLHGAWTFNAENLTARSFGTFEFNFPECGLGLFDEVNYATARSTFEQNDCILLFTDGLYEVESPDGEQFGMEAVISSLETHADLPAEMLFNALLADACDFSKKQEFDDDVCIVAVEQS